MKRLWPCLLMALAARAELPLFQSCAEVPAEARGRLEATLREDLADRVIRLCALTNARQRGDFALVEKHLGWFIEHYRECEFTLPMLESVAFTPADDGKAYERLRRKWLAAVKANPRDRALLADAAAFVWATDREQALEWWRRAASGPPRVYSTLLGRAYGRVIAGGAESKGSEAARQALEEAISPHLVRGAIAELAASGAQGEYRLKLQEKADGLAPLPAAGKGLVAPVLIRQVRPRYPEEARRQRIQGRVDFELVVSRAGYVLEASVLGGPPELVDVARDTVLRWVYQPAFQDGEPVELKLKTAVFFSLP